MPRDTPAKSPRHPPGPLVGLAVVLAILLNGLLPPGAMRPANLAGTFYLALYAHIGFSIHAGVFGRWRTATWLALMAVWIAGEAGAFLAYVIPWGQLSFWLAVKLTGLPLIGDRLWGPISSWHPLDLIGYRTWLVLSLAALCLDIAARHWGLWRRHSTLALFILVAGAVVAALALGLALDLVMRASGTTDQAPPAGELRIVPSWYVLPFYAVLRSVPMKLAGVLLTFATMLMPMLAPWMRGDRLRAGRASRLWAAACWGLAADWICLGLLGSQPPEAGIRAATLILAICYFSFFLIVPWLLGRIERTPERSASEPG